MGMKYKGLEFPLGGIDRRHAVQRQPPYTTPDALNVVPETLEDRRVRGGSRPGMEYYLHDTCGARPVNLLSGVRGARYETTSIQTGGVPSIPGVTLPDAMNTIFEDFAWENASNVWEHLGDLPYPAFSGNPPASMYVGECGACRKTFTYDTEKRIRVSMQVSKITGHPNSGTYRIIMGMDDDSPSIDGGAYGEVAIGEKTAVSLVVRGTQKYSGEVEATSGVLEIARQSDGSIELSFAGKLLYTDRSNAELEGTRIGFMLSASGENAIAGTDWIQATYYLDMDAFPPSEAGDPEIGLTINRYADMLVAGSDGDIYVESPKGALNKITSSVKTYQTKGYVMSQPRLTELFIADYMSLFNDTSVFKATGTAGSVTGGVLSDTGVSDWTALGINAGSDVVTITDAATGMDVGTYLISSVATGGITLWGYSGGDGTCTYYVTVSPKVYNPTTGTYKPWIADKGAVPYNCQLIALYRDRIVLAGADDSPHIWYMSRQGDPYDWDYTGDGEGDDAGIAVAGQASDAGIIGSPIRALIPHGEDYILFGYDSELWCLRGDPASGGVTVPLSREVGVCGKRAWCYGENGEVLFLSSNGIYVVSGAQAPQRLSADSIPVELVGRRFTDNIQLSYDNRWHGVHIFLCDESTHWFFSMETKSFWPICLAGDIRPTAVTRNGDAPVIGCRDGYLRRFSMDAMNDCGEPFDSFVLLGPVRMGGDDYSCGLLLKMLLSVVGSRSGEGMYVDIYTADEANELEEEYRMGRIKSTFMVRKGTAVNLRRLSGGCALFRLRQGNLSEWWGLERAGLYLNEQGRFRE